jgi:hypothetical protein
VGRTPRSGTTASLAAPAGPYAVAPTWWRLAEPELPSEAELVAIWEGQRQPPGALRTRDGRVITVIHPGRRNAGAGPDFRDAVILVGEERRLGAVELHVRASGFHQHGHEEDPAYAGLALHVVFEDDSADGSLSAGGTRAPVAAFAPWLRQRARDIASLLRQPPLFREPCRDAGGRLGRNGIVKALAAAGRRRFLARAGELAASARQDGDDAAVWRALLEALAYGGDRPRFQRLAAAAPLAALRRLADSAVAVEQALLAADRPDVGRPLATRPANAPARRIAAAARLLVASSGAPAARAVETVRTAPDARALVAAWRVGPARPGTPALLGGGRAQELVVNVVLPYAAGRPGLTVRALDLLEALPALPPYGRSRGLERNLTPGDGAGARPVASAVAQQGLLAFQTEWCSQGGCGRCPLS